MPPISRSRVAEADATSAASSATIISVVVVVLAVLTMACGGGVTPIRGPFNKGVYHYSQGRYDEAISAYRLALEEHPGDYQARFNLAEVLEARADRLERANHEEAAEADRRLAAELYQEILRQRPGDLRATVNLAAREYQRGERAAAEARLRDAMSRHPRSPLPRLALAAHRLRTADDPAALDDAVELLEEALDRDGSHLGANMLLGHAYATLAATRNDAGLRQRARDAYGRALKHDPQDLATLLGLGRLELAAGEAAAAESWLRRALYVHPDHLEAHLLLAQALEAEDDLEGATFHLWRARRLEDPDAPRLAAEEYRRRLSALYKRLAERETPDRP